MTGHKSTMKIPNMYFDSFTLTAIQKALLPCSCAWLTKESTAFVRPNFTYYVLTLIPQIIQHSKREPTTKNYMETFLKTQTRPAYQSQPTGPKIIPADESRLEDMLWYECTKI